MANAPSRKSSRRWWIAAVIGAALLALGWTYGDVAQGYARGGTAYGARVACSCRFVAGRSMADCAKDKIPGMDLITLVEDERRKSVTARFPLIASDTATYREGFGCVLQPWED